MKNLPKILSVIIPTFKREYFLKKKIEECEYLEEKEFDIEFVFVIEEQDSVSLTLIENSKIKCKKIAFNNTLPEFVARTGLNASTSNYVVFMGDDDYFNLKNDSDIKNLKFILNDLEINNHAWGIAQSSYLDKNEKKNRLIVTSVKKFLLRNYSSYMLSVVNFVMTPSVFIRRELVSDEIYFDPQNKYAQDYYTWFNFSKKFKPKIYNFEISKVIFSSHSISGSFNFERYYEYFKYISSRSKNFFTKVLQLFFTLYMVTHNYFKKKILWNTKNKKTFNFNLPSKNKIKILHLTRFFKTTSLGGIERGIINSNINCDKYNIQNDILTTTNDNNDYQLFEGIHVYYAKQTFDIQNNIISIDFINKFNKIKHNYDYINIHYPWPFADLVAALFATKKNKIILNYHADIVKSSFLRKVYYIFLKFFKNKIHFINISTKTYLLNSNCKNLFPNSKVFIQSPGYKMPRINNENIRSSIKKLFIDEKKFIFFIGKLRHYKGTDKLIKLIENNRDFNFIIFNNSVDLFLKLKKKDNVNFFFNTTDDEKFFVFKNSYLHIFPSDNKAESFGLTLLEAQLFGCPSIVYNLGTGVNEVIINNFNGITIQNLNDSFDLVIKKLINDEDHRNKLSKNTQTTKNKFSVDNYLSYYNYVKELYEKKIL